MLGYGDYTDPEKLKEGLAALTEYLKTLEQQNASLSLLLITKRRPFRKESASFCVIH